LCCGCWVGWLPLQDEIEIEFRDAETVCKGIIDVNERTIKGTVSQLVYQGEEGFYLPSNTATHQFNLKLVDEPSHIRWTRALLNHASQVSQAMLGYLFIYYFSFSVIKET
jgi:hypothetical protein